MHAKYEVSTSNGSKVIAKVKVDYRQTDKQTDRTKTICPRSFDPGAQKVLKHCHCDTNTRTSIMYDICEPLEYRGCITSLGGVSTFCLACHTRNVHCIPPTLLAIICRQILYKTFHSHENNNIYMRCSYPAFLFHCH